VDAISGQRIGATWIVGGQSLAQTFCLPADPWSAPAPGDPRPLVGVGTRLLGPAPAAPIDLPVDARIESFHPSGLCGVIDGQITDVITGDRVPLGVPSTSLWP
jgi:hypothetical protein